MTLSDTYQNNKMISHWSFDIISVSYTHLTLPTIA